MSSDPFVVISSATHAGAQVIRYRDYLDSEHQQLFDDWRGSYKNPQKKHIGSKKHLNWDDDARMTDMENDGVVGESVQGAVIASVLPRSAARDAGLRGGVLLPHVPDDCTSFIKPLYHPDYDRMWALLEETGLVINHHGGTGSPDYGKLPISLPIRLIETPFFSTRSYGQLLLSGVFHRFPKLKYIITESGCAWVPDTLQRLDWAWERIAKGAAGEFQFPEGVATPEPPSFYAQRNCYYGASSASPVEIRDRDVIGTERILWGSDYPHYEGTYPHTRLALRHTFNDVGEENARMMLGLNAAELYDFDLDALKPIAEKCGPTWDELSVPLAPSEFPEQTHTNAFRTA